MAVKAAPLAIGRALAAPPGTPLERVSILRKALAAVFHDADLQADFRKSQTDFSHITGDETLRLFIALMRQPPEMQQQIVKYLKFG